MIKRVLFAALVFAAPACAVSAQDAKVSVDMIGIGITIGSTTITIRKR